MSDKTSIEYGNHTWSPWRGCEPVSPGCAHCYASAICQHVGLGAYRRGMKRVLTKDWTKPVRWNRAAAKAGTRPRVLVSMCDPFDPEVPGQWTVQFWELVMDTPNLNWLLLTKRIEQFHWKAFDAWPLDNVWLGVSVEDQQRANERIPILLSTPATVHWVSYEPALGPVDLGQALDAPHGGGRLDWLVVGGESGFNHRRFDLEWLCLIVSQCRLGGVACFVKQDSHRFPGQQGRIPDELWKVKEFPQQ